MSSTWLGYSEPIDVSSIPRISVDEVAAALPSNRDTQMQLIDVRRSDLTVRPELPLFKQHARSQGNRNAQQYMIAGSVNLPAHTFYPSRRDIVQLLASSKKTTLVFYCNSSNGRGPRCAGWARDAIKEQGLPDVQVKIMNGGAKAFLAKFADNPALVYRLPDEVTSS